MGITPQVISVKGGSYSPKAYLPGSQMPFPGLPDAEDRADLIAYLKRATR
ncbi:MAG: hypothetical protein IID40_06435 [Planctomycetes bacterium]|nr:hypothetical protein [Planctomycetota bacterium]